MSLLPPNARLLVEIIGLDAALALIKALGGVTVTFGKGVRADGAARYAEIAEIVGEANAALLGQRLGGTPFPIPLCLAAIRAERDDRMREQFDRITRTASARAAVEQLARAHKMTDRNVWRVLGSASSAAGDDAQLGLF